MIVIEESHRRVRTNNTNRKVRRRDEHVIICRRNNNFINDNEIKVFVTFANCLERSILAESCVIYKKIGSSNYRDYKRPSRLQVTQDARNTHDEAKDALELVMNMNRISNTANRVNRINIYL